MNSTHPQLSAFRRNSEITHDQSKMANLSNPEAQALIDWRSSEENRKVFQKLLDDLDNLLDSLRARMNESAGDEDGKASAPPCVEEPESCLLEGHGGPDKKPQFLPKWSPWNPAQKRCDTDKEDRKEDEKDLQSRCEERGKYGEWSMSEIKEDPESSQFLLRWPPDGSVFVRSGGAEPHHS